MLRTSSKFYSVGTGYVLFSGRQAGIVDDFDKVSSSGGQLSLVENFDEVYSVVQVSHLLLHLTDQVLLPLTDQVFLHLSDQGLVHLTGQVLLPLTFGRELYLDEGLGHGLLPGDLYYVLVVHVGDGICCLLKAIS